MTDSAANIKTTAGTAWHVAAGPIADKIGHVTNAGSPVGTLTPLYVGQECFDTTNNNWWKANGTANTNWVETGGATDALGTTTITSTSADALAVGANGATNPVLQVDASTASVATGIDIKGAAAASGVAVSVISSGTNENFTIDAKGSGTITLGGTSTGVTRVGSGGVAVDSGTKTASATAGAATLAKMAGVITSESLSTAAGATYTLTLTNTDIAAADQVFASVQLGTATTGMPAVTTVKPGAGSVVIVVQNIHASAALNGTIEISFLVVKN